MSSMIVLAKRYPIVAFFVLTFVISWFFWIPVALSSQGILPFQIPFALFVLGGYGPSLAGVIMAGIEKGKPGMRELFGRLRLWRVGIQWYVFVLLSTVLVGACVLALHPLLGGETRKIDLLHQLRSLLGILPMLILLGGPMPEELGWRGFALQVALQIQCAGCQPYRRGDVGLVAFASILDFGSRPAGSACTLVHGRGASGSHSVHVGT